ncbi:two-component system, response regulator YcbB [Lutispora thermophila DSM 19022]|uniref:Stage 0 sporulation protein A homolog n=2 Tax=Lutispora TaxID=667112 RepID=A0A1M6FG19_9FIRM|nr:two-component system, response regulator YcbB [Lutispora thermophila DSM 19022]
MKYYIVDDDINIVKILSNIIEDNNLGDVVGYSYDGETAYKEILATNPDIVLVDLLMPKLDGNTLVREVKQLRTSINFVMVSQVSDSQLITESYKSGIEFFISKPLNKIEVEKVVNKVAEKIKLEEMLNNIRKVFSNVDRRLENIDKRDRTKEIRYILSMLGMLGEKGTNDIINTCTYLINMKKSFNECSMDEICKYLKENSKTVRQRMRRAMKEGLKNLANTGLEDYGNEYFQRYANMLFDFESVKAEMDFIRGKRNNGGKVNMGKFFEGLILLSEKEY